MRILSIALHLTAALCQYVPEPYGWACYRMAGKRKWPQCATASRSEQRACLCGIPEFVALTESCLEQAVANATDPESSAAIARDLSLCPVQKSSLDSSKSIKRPISDEQVQYTPLDEIIDPINAEEIEIAMSTADWRMTNDRSAERAGASLVSYWGLVVLMRYLAHILGKFVPYTWLTRLVLWKPVRNFRAHFINAPLGSRHHNEPLSKNLGIRLPIRSVTLILLIFTALNYTLIFTDYIYTDNNFIYTTHSQQRNKTVAIRCAFVIMWKLPLVFCFAGRNNIFLLIGHPWSLDTFNTFHKWIARLTIVDMIIHGIAISLVKAEQSIYGYVWSVDYWLWGVSGVIIAATILVQSQYWISRLNYEFFKVFHTVLVVFFVVTTWCHVSVLPYGVKHTYAVVAIWASDILCRLIRIGLAGRVKAQLHHHGEDIMTLTISMPDSYRFARSSQSAFLFVHMPPFYMFWQSHPFTVMECVVGENILNTSVDSAPSQSTNTSTTEPATDKVISSVTKDTRKSEKDSMAREESGLESFGFELNSVESEARSKPGKSGELVLGIKAQKGITRKLAKMDDGPITIAIDGPYGKFFPMQNFRQLIFIAGGIGITAHLSDIQYLIKRSCIDSMQIRLYWVVRRISDYDWIKEVLSKLSDRVVVEIYCSEESADNSVCASDWAAAADERSDNIFYGTRFKALEAVKKQVSLINNSEKPHELTTAILACGPRSLNDDARLAACWAIRHAETFVNYFEDSFSW